MCCRESSPRRSSAPSAVLPCLVLGTNRRGRRGSVILSRQHGVIPVPAAGGCGGPVSTNIILISNAEGGANNVQGFGQTTDVCRGVLSFTGRHHRSLRPARARSTRGERGTNCDRRSDRRDGRTEQRRDL